MTDKDPQFQGFIDDDQPTKSASPTNAPKPAAFNPFADQPVDVPNPAAAAPAAPVVPAASAPAAAKPGAAAVARKPAASPAEADDPDFKPGPGRKDLWKCPHCETGNKPDRTTCRSCGKSPSDPVRPKWLLPVAIGGGVVAIVVVVILLVGRGAETTLHRPGLAGVDDKVRIGRAAEGRQELPENRAFIAKKACAVTGRIATAEKFGPGLHVRLALGHIAAGAEQVDKVAAGDVPAVELILIGSNLPAKLERGHWLSVAGQTGDLLEDGRFWKEAQYRTPVWVTEIQTAAAEQP
jgi:hypothetical protein